MRLMTTRTGMITVLAVFLCFTASSCSIGRSNVSSPSYQNYFASKQFYVDAKNIGLKSLAQGTIFVTGEKDKLGTYKVQICAQISIDPNDFGGVVFAVPKKDWKLSEVLTDYPSGVSGMKEPIGDMGSLDYSSVVIGERAPGGLSQSIGGSGNIIINFESTQTTDSRIKNVVVLIRLGKDGANIWPVGQTIDIPFS